MDPFSHASKGHSGLRPQLLRRGFLVLCSSSGKGERESVGVIELKALMVNCHIYLYYGRFLMKSPILKRVQSNAVNIASAMARLEVEVGVNRRPILTTYCTCQGRIKAPQYGVVVVDDLRNHL